MITLEAETLQSRFWLDGTTEVVAAPGPGRLIEGGDAQRSRTLVAHRRQYGAPQPAAVPSVAIGRLVAEAGLTGRGGAAFSTARKLAAVAERGGWTVVANGTEGEPASRKDQLLMTLRPHLVLDGAMLAAAATGAGSVVICISEDRPAALASMTAAVAERAAFGEVPHARVVATPPRYVSGEETALVRWLNGGPAKPSAGRRRPFDRGVRNRPTLVQNVETLANLPLITRHGPGWYRSRGTQEEPGTRLVTVALGAGRLVVLEAACGASLSEVLTRAGVPTAEVQAVLVGGLYGTWLTGRSAAAAARLSRSGLMPFGASPGAGVLAPVPWDVCGLRETARILTWYAGESAGQCGPCRFGLPALAGVLGEVAAGRPRPGAMELIDHYSEDIEGRGGCRLPDGAVQLLRSARVVFADDFTRHLAGQSCRCRPEPQIGFRPNPAVGQ